MIRLETETGYWLVTHPDHARLAGAIAENWGNELFTPPEPRAHVLFGISVHDDGWAQRDAHPSITRQGKPSAFSVELVGKYSAFEEIDLQDYLNVRDRAVAAVAEKDPYGALLVSKHTYNLLTARADRSTIAPEQLPLLDGFLERQRRIQAKLFATIRKEQTFSIEEISDERIEDNFRLLQAADNMSLLACVDYGKHASLLHPLPTTDGGHAEVRVTPLGERHFRLDPYPLREARLSIGFPARHVQGSTFSSSAELEALYAKAPVETLTLTLSL